MNQTLRVLIVDDEASQRAGLAGMVTAWGMVSETASDGLEALEKLSRIPVDVILTDLNMPGMDGFELLDNLRNLGDSPPTIVLTAYGSMDSAVKTVHELGAFWFLEKPIQASALEALVRRAASHGRLRERQPQPRNATALQGIAGRPGGHFRQDAGDFRAAAAGRTEQSLRADHRRERDRKRNGRARAFTRSARGGKVRFTPSIARRCRRA